MDCYILAGGKSRRFGQDKTLFSIFGKPIVSHVVERAKLVCNSVSILCKDRNKYAFLEGGELPSTYGGGGFLLQRALFALSAGVTSDRPSPTSELLYTETKHLSTATHFQLTRVGDFLQKKGVKVIEDLKKEQFPLAGVYTALKVSSYEKVLILSADMPFLKPNLLLNLYENSEYPVTVYKVDSRVYPFPGVYYKQILEHLEAYMASGKKKVTEFLEYVGFKFIRIEPKDKLSFLNINTQEDVDLIRRCCMEKVLLVKGMTCEHCVETVKRALFDLEGVSHVDVDLQKGEVKVFLERDVPFETLKESIERWGYSVVGEV